MRVRQAPVRPVAKILDYNSGVASKLLAYENIHLHIRYHGDYGLGQCRHG